MTYELQTYVEQQKRSSLDTCLTHYSCLWNCALPKEVTFLKCIYFRSNKTSWRNYRQHLPLKFKDIQVQDKPCLIRY